MFSFAKLVTDWKNILYVLDTGQFFKYISNI